MRRLVAASAASSLAICLNAYGQTSGTPSSGTWIATTSSGVDWSTASQWSGSVPSSGGVASFIENAVPVPGSTPTVSADYTLSQINIASAAPYQFTGGGGFVFPSAGGTINISRSAGNDPLDPIQPGSAIGVALSGGPLSVTGSGAVTLGNSSNTFEGGITINQATVLVASDGALGGTDQTTDGITLSNGTLATTTGGLTTGRAIAVNGISSLVTPQSINLNGVVSGSGSLVQTGLSTGLVAFNAPNTFSGSLIDNSWTNGNASQGTLVQGNGTFLNVGSVYENSYLTIDDSQTNIQNRFAPTTNFYLSGGDMFLRNADTPGNASNPLLTTTTEMTAGLLQLSSGSNVVGLQNVVQNANATNVRTQAGITFTGINRSNRSVLLVYGGLLGDGAPTPKSGIATLISQSPLSVVGSNGAAGTPSVGIVPWVIAVLNTNNGTTAGVATFGVSNASNGAIRPLGWYNGGYTNEFDYQLGVAADNVRLPSGFVPGGIYNVSSGGQTCNSLTLYVSGPSGVTLNGPGTLTVSSGGILTTANNIASSQYQATVNAPIAFPSGVEGILQLGLALTTTNTISGNNGVTTGFDGTWTVTGSSTYSGVTTLNNAVTIVSGNLPVNANSAFGNTSAAIVLSAGSHSPLGSSNAVPTTLEFATNSQVDRSISILGASTAANGAEFATMNGTQQVVFNGTISLGHSLTLNLGLPTIVPGTPAANATFNGVISGSGALLDGGSFSSSQILNGANTFTGGIVAQFGQFYAGNNLAFGSGPIYVASQQGQYPGSAFATIGATAGPAGTDTLRVLQNNLVVNSGGIDFNNAIPLKLNGSVELNGLATTFIVYGAATQLAGNILSGGLTVAGGQNLILSGTNTFTGGVAVSAGGGNVSPDGATVLPGMVTFASPGALPAYSTLSIGSGAIAVASNHLTGPDNNLLASNLSIAGSTNNWTGLLDLTNNNLVIRGGDLSTVTNQIKQGYNNGNWQGSGGITSGTAAADFRHLTALGVILNDNGQGSPLYGSGGSLAGSFDGINSVLLDDVLVKYTYYGDANLDGKVDGSDYTRIDAGYLSQSGSNPRSGWSNGDFNYDGVIDGSDYTLIDNAFNMQGAKISSQVSFSPAGALETAEVALGNVVGTTAVPEPSSVAIALMIATGGLSRRNRRSIKRNLNRAGDVQDACPKTILNECLHH